MPQNENFSGFTRSYLSDKHLSQKSDGDEKSSSEKSCNLVNSGIDDDGRIISKKVKGKIIEVDIGNILHNLFFLKERKSENSFIFPVLKSCAYGHGIEVVAKTINDFIDGFCVAVVEEAEKIRKVSDKPIIVLKGAFCDDEIDFCKKNSIWITVRDEYDLRDKVKRKIPFFIKIDTGMGRLGFLPSDFDRIISILEESGAKDFIKGLISHFAFSDLEDNQFVMEQISIFREFYEKFERKIGRKILKSLSNSAGTILRKDAHFDIVRPGIALYGITPFFSEMKFSENLKPALSVKTEVIAVKEIPKGWSVGYSRKFIASEKAKVAILNVGYSDGIPRSWWEKGYVIINGKRMKIVGVISMDMMAVLCSGEKVFPGDTVTILGKDGNETISAYEIAKLVGTIPYEILCNLGLKC